MEKREYNTQGETTYFGLLVWNEKRGGISLIGPTVDKNNTLTFGVLKTFFPENTKFPYQSLRTSETDINYDWLEDNLGQRAIFSFYCPDSRRNIRYAVYTVLPVREIKP